MRLPWQGDEEKTRYKEALEEIKREQGKVCNEFELCEHEACMSSCAFVWNAQDGRCAICRLPAELNAPRTSALKAHFDHRYPLCWAGVVPMYVVITKLNDGTYGLATDFGPQLWVRAAMRKAHVCDKCRALLNYGDNAYRPITNARNRMKRVCVECIESQNV